MSDLGKIIHYESSFKTSFLGMETSLHVTCPIDKPTPSVKVIIYAKSGKLSLEESFFEALLTFLIEIREHIQLLAGSESSPSTDPQVMLVGEVTPARIEIRRKLRLDRTIMDKVQIMIGDFQIERELDNDLLEAIKKLRSAIEVMKTRVTDKIREYRTHKK